MSDLNIRVIYGIINIMDKRKYADRREYNIMAVGRRRRKLRQMAVYWAENV
jgi:hypothetical protein